MSIINPASYYSPALSSGAGSEYVQSTLKDTVPSSASSIPVVVTVDRLSKVRSCMIVFAAADLLPTRMEKLTCVPVELKFSTVISEGIFSSSSSIKFLSPSFGVFVY